MSGATRPDPFSGTFTVIVKPHSSKTRYNGLDEQGRHRIELREKAEDNKANLALIKFFKKEFGLRVRIKTGLTRREKVVEAI